MSKFQVIVYGETTAINQLLFDEFIKVLVRICGDPYCKWMIKRIPMSSFFPDQEVEIVTKDVNKIATLGKDGNLKIEDAAEDEWIPVIKPSDLSDEEKQQIQEMKKKIEKFGRLFG